MTAGGATLVLIDLQRIFSDASSPWCTPGYEGAARASARLQRAFGDRTAFTRFMPPTDVRGSWVEYYREWPFALEPQNAGLYDLTPEFAGTALPVIDRTTFGKWDADASAMLGDPAEIVLAGVATDCCVLSTALAAADAGVRVRVAADACAGVSVADHDRALAAMQLYAPHIEITTVDDVLRSLDGDR